MAVAICVGFPAGTSAPTPRLGPAPLPSWTPAVGAYRHLLSPDPSYLQKQDQEQEQGPFDAPSLPPGYLQTRGLRLLMTSHHASSIPLRSGSGGKRSHSEQETWNGTAHAVPSAALLESQKLF